MALRNDPCRSEALMASMCSLPAKFRLPEAAKSLKERGPSETQAGRKAETDRVHEGHFRGFTRRSERVLRELRTRMLSYNAPF